MQDLREKAKQTAREQLVLAKAEYEALDHDWVDGEIIENAAWAIDFWAQILAKLEALCD